MAILATGVAAGAVAAQVPEVRVGALAPDARSVIQLDGRLDEAAWQAAPVIDGFTQVEPVEGAPAAFRTRVRVLGADLKYAFGPFYDGHLQTIEVEAFVRPHPLLTLGFDVELNRADLPQGKFSEDVCALRADVNVSSDLAVRSLVQYDTDSRLLGTNTRLRWTVSPEQEIACVLNSNARREDGPHLRSESDAAVVKAQHTFRF